jgi:hypothetical protein
LSLSNLSATALKNIARALADGDVEISRWVVEHIIGKPTQKSQVTGANNGPIKIENTLNGLLTTPEACDALSEFIKAVSAKIPDALTTNAHADANANNPNPEHYDPSSSVRYEPL